MENNDEIERLEGEIIILIFKNTTPFLNVTPNVEKKFLEKFDELENYF